MKPKIHSARASRCLCTLTLVFTAAMTSLHAESWNIVGNAPTLPNTVNYSNYNWDDAANWTPNSIPNAVDASAQFDINILLNTGGSQLQGTQQINLNVPTVLGNLTLGDALTSPNPNGNGFYNIANGTAGSLTFESTVPALSPTATLQKTVGSGTLDTISATITLASPLKVDVRTGAIEIGNTVAGPIGRIGGSHGILRSAGVTAPAVPTTGGSNLILSNPGNTYTGDTIIEHGTLSARLSGDVLVSTPSNFGNSANPIVIGTAATPANNNGTSVLTFIAGNDTSNYTVTRGLDFSAFTTGQTSRQGLNFNGNLYNFNAAQGLNTNTLTLAGPITIGGRTSQIGVGRSGMTLYITGDMTGSNSGSIDVMRFNNFPNPTNVDGRGAGTIRMSNRARTFSAATALLSGTLVIEGDVPSGETPSPIGLKPVNLAIGSGGNILGGANFSAGAAAALDTAPDTTRSLYLSTAGSTYARAIGIGSGSTTTATGVTGASTGSTAIPALYGLNDGAAATAQSQVNVINGFRIGGLNTTGITTFSGNLNSGTLLIGNENPDNTIELGVNLALMSANGGTTAFTGVINDTSNGAGLARPSMTRVTINQFRNHPNLDGNKGTTVGADGIKDAAADMLVGTATNGTVILSGSNTYEGGTEVLGGTLTVNNGFGSGVGNGDVKVAAGAKFGGNGTIFGSATLDNGAGLAFTVNTLIGEHNSFDIFGDLTLSGTTAVTILDGIGAEIGSYTLAIVGGTITGTPLVTPILPAGMKGTISVDGGELKLNVTEVVSADYIAWISDYPSITGLDRAGSADFDGDGATHQEEYAFGLDPESGTSSSPIIVPLNKSNGKFTYTRRVPTLPDPDLVFTVKTSTSLGGWTKDDGATEQVLSTVDDIQTVEVTLSSGLLSNATLFVRVEAQ